MPESEAVLKITTIGGAEAEAQLRRISSLLRQNGAGGNGFSFDMPGAQAGAFLGAASAFGSGGSIPTLNFKGARMHPVMAANLNYMLNVRGVQAFSKASATLARGRVMNAAARNALAHYADVKALLVMDEMMYEDDLIPPINRPGRGGPGRAGFMYIPGAQDLKTAGRQFKNIGKKIARKAMTHIVPAQYRGLVGGMMRGAVSGAAIGSLATIGYKTGEMYYNLASDPSKFYYGDEYQERRSKAFQGSILGRSAPAYGYTHGDMVYQIGVEQWRKKNVLKKLWDIGSWEFYPENMGPSLMGNSDPHFIDTPELQELSTEVLPLARFMSWREDVMAMARKAIGKDKDKRQAIYRQFIIENNQYRTPGFVYHEEKRKARVRANAGVA